MPALGVLVSEELKSEKSDARDDSASNASSSIPDPRKTPRHTNITSYHSSSPRHNTSYHTTISGASSNTSYHTINWKALPFGSGYYVPERYAIPTHLLGEIFRSLDRRDSPAQPGRLKYSTIQSSINRFHAIFCKTGMWSCPECGEEQLKRDIICRRCHAPVPMDVVTDDVPPGVTQLHAEVAAALHKILTKAQKHQRQYSTRTLDEVTVRWDQGFLLDCFQVELNLKERIFFTFDISENSTLLSKSVSWIQMLAVLISILTFILSTLPSADETFGGWVPWVDVACVCIFTVDYATRLLTVSFARTELLDRPFIEAAITGSHEVCMASPLGRLVRFITSPMGIVDLISVIPFWIEVILGPDDVFKMESDGESSSGVLRVFRVIRIIRVFKLGTLAKADLGQDNNMVVNLFGEVVAKARPALQLVLVLVVLAMLVFGTLIWFTERGTLFKQNQPDCPHPALCADGPIRLRGLVDGSYENSASPFESIPVSFWWVLVTITTVGYGDHFPVTPLGYVIGSVTIFYGVVVFALPVGIIGTTFSQAYDSLLAEQHLRQALETENHRRVSRPSRRSSLVGPCDMETFDQSTPPPLVVEFLTGLKQTCMAAGLPAEMMKRWEERLLVETTFERFTEEHPCEALERWGQPVLATLRESVESIPVASHFFTQTRGAWYRLLLHTAQAYEDFQETLRRSDFVGSMHGPLRQGSMKLSTTDAAPRFSMTHSAPIGISGEVGQSSTWNLRSRSASDSRNSIGRSGSKLKMAI